MKAPIRDVDLLTRLLGRTVTGIECESLLGMSRVTGLEFEGGSRFPLPTGNALRSAGEVAEVRALISGLSRQVAGIIRRRLGTGDPAPAAARIMEAVDEALVDPDAVIETSGPGFPLAQP